mmetsp:Transcript_15288/g.41886  ORF Transcript_15288/g.41886 Transcript_15288/m.41886 type:complete len:91 (-) Transcript_15288:15-287(-)
MRCPCSLIIDKIGASARPRDSDAAFLHEETPSARLQCLKPGMTRFAFCSVYTQSARASHVTTSKRSSSSFSDKGCAKYVLNYTTRCGRCL